MWTKDFPTQKGLFWFFGKLNSDDRRSKIHLVSVSEKDNQIRCISEGVVMIDNNGFFHDASVLNEKKNPVLPEDFDFYNNL